MHGKVRVAANCNELPKSRAVISCILTDFQWHSCGWMFLLIFAVKESALHFAVEVSREGTGSEDNGKTADAVDAHDVLRQQPN
jgi:hypothetical protein